MAGVEDENRCGWPRKGIPAVTGLFGRACGFAGLAKAAEGCLLVIRGLRLTSYAPGPGDDDPIFSSRGARENPPPRALTTFTASPEDATAPPSLALLALTSKTDFLGACRAKAIPVLTSIPP